MAQLTYREHEARKRARNPETYDAEQARQFRLIERKRIWRSLERQMRNRDIASGRRTRPGLMRIMIDVRLKAAGLL